MITLAPVTGVKAQSFNTCKCQLPIDNSFQVVPMTLGAGSDTDIAVPPLYENDNATTPALALPFNFCFYGQTFDSVFISNNGIVSFLKPIHAFIDSTQSIPLGHDTMMIAPFFADANTFYNRGVVYYKITPTYMVVIWDSVRFAGTDVDGWNYFQLIISNGTDPIIPDGNNISFCYPVMQWACSESSGGFSGYGGTPAFIGLNKGDGTTFAQISRFSLGGNYFYGPFDPHNGVDWLDFTSFTLNSCVNNNVIPPVIYNHRSACNTLYICPCDTTPTERALGAPDSLFSHHCDTVRLSAAFLCAQRGQKATVSYTSPGPLNIFSVDTSTVNLMDSITVTIIPAFGDTGTRIVSLIATDSVNHVHSTLSYTIVVTNDCVTAGVDEPEPKNSFVVYPNPASKYLTIQPVDAAGIVTAKIYDVLGTELLVVGGDANHSGKYNIDVSHLARGMYFVELINNGAPVAVKKIVIE